MTWIYAAASVMGAAHRQYDIPCQDHCAFLALSPQCHIAVVCDGAGSCDNAHIGAQQTANFALNRFSDYCQTQLLCPDTPLPNTEQWREQALQNVQLIKNDLLQYAQQNDLPFPSLACTLIVLIHTPLGLLCVHIGDGRAAYRTAQGEWEALIAPFHGEEINSTVFITSNFEQNTAEYIKTIQVNKAVTAFCLLSDGCERASFEINLFDAESGKYYDPNRPYLPFFEPNIVALQQLHQQQKTQAEINQLWAAFLENGNEKLRSEPDDKTMILATISTSVELV